MQTASNPSRGSRGPTGARPSSLASLSRAISILRKHWRLALPAYVALLVSTAAQLAVPQFVQRIIDSITNGVVAQQVAAMPAAAQEAALASLGWSPAQFTLYSNAAARAVLTAGILIVVFAAARGVFAFAQSYIAERASQEVAFDLRNDLFTRIQTLSFSYHDRNQTGQLMVRATDDVEKVRQFIGQGLLLALQAVILLVGALILLTITNLRLTLIILPILPIALVVFMVFGRMTQPLFMRVQQRLSVLNTLLQENLAGIKVVKAFAREPQEEARFAVAADNLMQQQVRVARVFSLIFPLVFLLANVGQAAVMYFGGRQIIGGTLTFGEWQKFSLYLAFVFFPLGQLGLIISQMSQASASADRIFEIMDAQSEVSDKPGAAILPPAEGRVAFEDVAFRYFGSSKPVLQDVSFVAEPGQTVALLGATGSGKTTVINLIPRFYDVTSGRVTVDGYDVREVTLDSLRSQIGIVLQETNLFSGTIRDNIAFGRPEATMDEIIAAAQAAAAHEFIAGFPEGYDTPVGERGTTLSGGQKQRIAIARALLLNPHILILDDSTSSVDTVTEHQIQQALDRLMAGRTSFVIAQRISTVRRADQILILEDGRVVASGSHDELIENSPIYAEIYASQLIEDAPTGVAAAPASIEEVREQHVRS
jgi:ATP-binding cassette subfamily B protein